MSDGSKQSAHLKPGTKFGSYSITRCIGEGGMGVVYEGVHEGLAKRVAIKTLNALGAQTPDVVARFVREGKAAAKISHPNVVDVVDVAVQDGIPYLVMEYLEGEDLGARMEHETPMGPGAIADLMIPVISALSAAHEVGIVHRDLKPDNIFLTRTKGGGLEPKLVDFGISKLQDGESLHLTGTGAILGTPYYMSPEQAGSSKQVDHRSDIFSLGVILYQCATHELPFKGDSLYQLLGEILHSQPPPVRSLANDVPPSFEAVIVRAMQKDPDARFQSAAQLGAALLPFASPRVRLSYEQEFGPARVPVSVAPAIRNATSPGNRRLLLGGAVLLGIAAAVAAAFALRNRDESLDRAHTVAPKAPSAPSAATPPAKQEPAVAVAAPGQTAVALVPAAATHDAGVQPTEKPAQPAKPESASAPATATTSTGTTKAHEHSSSASARHKSTRTPGSETPASAATPAGARPASATPTSNSSSKTDDLFRDRK